MKPNQQFLSALLKTVQLGQVQIRSVLDTSMRSSLRNTLESQLQEYNSMETEAYTIALQRGWELPELDPGLRFLTDRTTRFRLHGRNTDSSIADMMIRKNTGTLIKGTKKLHQFQDEDPQIRILSQKLLDCETANIRQLQQYL